MLWAGAREIRPATVPEGRTRALAFGAVRGVLADGAVRWLFAVYGTVFMARQLVNPFLPILVAKVNGPVGVEGAIGLVVGTAALVGAAASPVVGPVGDRVGFGPVLVVTLLVGTAAVAFMPVAPTTLALAGLAAVYAAVFALTAAMVFALLSVEVPPERRSATLNLVYVPLYVSGIVGPAIGAGLVTLGLGTPFVAAGAVLAAGAVGVLATPRRRAAHRASGRRGAVRPPTPPVPLEPPRPASGSSRPPAASSRRRGATASPPAGWPSSPGSPTAWCTTTSRTSGIWSWR
jgi:MFS family permease